MSAGDDRPCLLRIGAQWALSMGEKKPATHKDIEISRRLHHYSHSWCEAIVMPIAAS